MLWSLLRRNALSGRGRTGPRPGRRCRPVLEALEGRITPYVLSGYQWANVNVSVSYMPDGTLISSSYPSNLFAVYNAAYTQATWQREVARALQSWADVSNLNFHFVADDGSPQGTPGLAQGDSRFGDIRIGGYNMGSGILGIGWSPGSTTTAGDVELSTGSAFAIGSMPDLASVVMHEVGHGIGLNHTLVDPAVMEGGLWGVYPGPYADDIAGVQAMYGARKPDAYDAAAPNDSMATATALPLSYGSVAVSADITTMTDVDYYKVTAPSGTDGTLTVSVDARNLSLFDPQVSVYNSSGTLVATASAATYGDVATVNLSGLVAGQAYYLKASGATTDAFGMGAYRLTAQFGGVPQPPPIGPDKFEPNNTPATAANLGKVSSTSQTGLTLDTSSDVDYYTFTAGAKGTFTVSISPTQGSGTLGLTVLNAQQAVLATGQSQTGGVTLSVSLASGQQYYVKVWSPSGSLLAYNLSVAQSGGGGGGARPHKLVLGSAENPGAEPGGDFFFRNAADDPDNARPAPPNPAPRPSFAQAGEAARATGTSVSLGLPPAAGAFLDRAGDQASLAGALLHLAPQPPATPVLAAVTATAVANPSGVVVTGLQPPPTPVESGAALAGPEGPGAVPAGRDVPQAGPTVAPLAPEAEAEGGMLAPQPACDACFAAGFWADGPAAAAAPWGDGAEEGSGPAPAALAFLGAFGGTLWAGAEPRRQRQALR